MTRMLPSFILRYSSSSSFTTTSHPEKLQLYRRILKSLTPPPAAPKKPSTPYSLFTLQKFADFKNNGNYKGLGFTALTAEVVSAWKNLSEADKTTYTLQAQKAKEDYASQYQEWLSKRTPEDAYTENYIYKLKCKLSPRNKLAPPRDLAKPNRALTPYFLFIKDVHGASKQEQLEKFSLDLAGLSLGQQAKAIAQVWKKMSHQQKQPYISEFESNAPAYANARKAYDAKLENVKEKIKNLVLALERKKKSLIKKERSKVKVLKKTTQRAAKKSVKKPVKKPVKK